MFVCWQMWNKMYPKLSVFVHVDKTEKHIERNIITDVSQHTIKNAFQTWVGNAGLHMYYELKFENVYLQ